MIPSLALILAVAMTPHARAQEPLPFEDSLSRIMPSVAAALKARTAADIDVAAARASELASASERLLGETKVIRCRAKSAPRPARYGRCGRGATFAQDVRALGARLEKHALGVQSLEKSLGAVLSQVQPDPSLAEGARKLQGAAESLDEKSAPLARETAQAAFDFDLLEGRAIEGGGREAFAAARRAKDTAGRILAKVEEESEGTCSLTRPTCK